MTKLFIGSSLAMLASAAIAAPAAAQDINAEPNYETLRLDPGFTPDPYVIDLDSGGSRDASDISSDCVGFIADAPDVRLHYGEGSGVLPLIIGAESEHDTTLVVNAPDGGWYCDDDRGEGLNPLVRFNEPSPGRYEIWVGTWGDADVLPAKLVITELVSTLTDDRLDDSSDTVADGGGATYGSVDLSSGFTPDPYTVRLQSGGSVSASEISSDCRGYIASAPDFELNYSAGSLPLYISVDSMADTTLVVQAPNGQYFCDDDSGEGTNPRVWLEIPLSGTYQIWVGTYGSSDLEQAELNISELYSQ